MLINLNVTELKYVYKLFRIIPGLACSAMVLWDTCSMQSNCRTKAASDAVAISTSGHRFDGSNKQNELLTLA